MKPSGHVHASPFVSARHAVALATVLLGAAACVEPPPDLLIGTFRDDYGSAYTITSTAWTHDGAATYHVVRWNVAEQYLIARNDSANASAPGRWSRIDWVPLDGMSPYEWGYCYSAYDAESAAAAESVSVARRDTPRTGCNGFPFTRMAPE